MGGIGHPRAERIGWRVGRGAVVFESRWFRLRSDRLLLPGGRRATYSFLVHPGSVFVVPVTPRGEIVLIRSFRYPIDAWCWEVPAGSLADRRGVAPGRAARRELSEELGATCDRLRLLGRFHLDNSIARHLGHFFLAERVLLAGERELEPLEVIDRVLRIPVAEGRDAVRKGLIRDAESAFAVLLALEHMEVRT